LVDASEEEVGEEAALGGGEDSNESVSWTTTVAEEEEMPVEHPEETTNLVDVTDSSAENDEDTTESGEGPMASRWAPETPAPTQVEAKIEDYIPEFPDELPTVDEFLEAEAKKEQEISASKNLRSRRKSISPSPSLKLRSNKKLASLSPRATLKYGPIQSRCSLAGVSGRPSSRSATTGLAAATSLSSRTTSGTPTSLTTRVRSAQS
jgi:hypothetical protein